MIQKHGTSERSKAIKNLDGLWSRFIRERDGFRCRHCGTRSRYVQAAHIFRRGNFATRWDTRNGITLCSMCHIFSATFSAHTTPTEFAEWVRKEIGESTYQSIKKKADDKTYQFYHGDFEKIKSQLEQ